MKQILALMLVAILVAGCSGDGDPQDAQPSAKPPQPPPEQAAPENQTRMVPTPSAAISIYFTDCKLAVSLLVTPRDTIQEPQPTPWKGNQTFDYHLMDAFSCTRVGWGDFERGPLNFLLESASITGMPDSCRGLGGGHIRYAHRIYAADENLGQRFAKALDIPFIVANVELELGSLATGVASTIRVSPQGHEPSEIVAMSRPDINPHPVEDALHFLTTNHTHSGRLSLDYTAVSESVDVPALGEFSRPTLASYGPTDRYPMAVNHLTNLQGTGVAIQWDAPNCGS